MKQVIKSECSAFLQGLQWLSISIFFLGFPLGLQVQNVMKLKQHLPHGVKIDPKDIVAGSKAHPSHSFGIDGRRKPEL